MRNLYKDILDENKERIQFVPSEDKETNVIYNSSQDYYLGVLQHFCVDVFDENKKLLRKRRIVRNLKFFVSCGIPLVCAIVASKFILKVQPVQKVIPAYALEKTMFSDGKVWKECDDDIYIQTDDKNFEGEVIAVSDLASSVQYQIKDGTKNIIANFELDSNGELKLLKEYALDIYNNDINAGDRNMNFEDATDDYQELIDEMRELISEEYSFGDKKVSLSEIISSEDAEEIVTILKYVQNGEYNYITPKASENSFILLLMFVNILINSLFSGVLFSKCKMPILENKLMGELAEREEKEVVSLLSTTISDKRKFAKAEEERIDYIEEFVKLKLTKESQKYFDV